MPNLFSYILHRIFFLTNSKFLCQGGQMLHASLIPRNYAAAHIEGPITYPNLSECVYWWDQEAKSQYLKLMMTFGDLCAVK